MIYNRQIVTSGYASNTSACTQSSTATYFSASRTLSITTSLDDGTGNCDYLQGSVSCSNPCPNILAPQGFGYNPQVATTTSMTWSVDMASVSTAIAVNMGIQKLSKLVQYPGDNNRIRLLKDMVSAGYITNHIKNNTNSYYESLYAPMEPIYWLVPRLSLQSMY